MGQRLRSSYFIREGNLRKARVRGRAVRPGRRERENKRAYYWVRHSSMKNWSLGVFKEAMWNHFISKQFIKGEERRMICPLAAILHWSKFASRGCQLPCTSRSHRQEGWAGAVVLALCPQKQQGNWGKRQGTKCVGDEWGEWFCPTRGQSEERGEPPQQTP